jgi:hypothetical protein
MSKKGSPKLSQFLPSAKSTTLLVPTLNRRVLVEAALSRYPRKRTFPAAKASSPVSRRFSDLRIITQPLSNSRANRNPQLCELVDARAPTTRSARPFPFRRPPFLTIQTLLTKLEAMLNRLDDRSPTRHFGRDYHPLSYRVFYIHY